MVLFGYLIMCLIFGTTFLAIKAGIDAGSLPFFSAGIRFTAAGLILLSVMVWQKKGSFSLLWKKESIVTGACLTFGTFSSLYWAEQYIASGLAAVLSATGPIMILVLQAAVLRQKAAPRAVAGCLIGFAGVALILLPGLSVGAGLLWVAGCAAVLIGELCYSSGALYSKRVMKHFTDVSAVALNAAQMTAGGVLLLVLSAFAEKPDLSVYASPAAAGSLLYLIVAGSMVGHTLFYWLVSKSDPVFPSTWLYVSPPIAMALGWLIYGEPLSWLTAAGVAAILFGIILVNFGLLKPYFSRLRPGRPRTDGAASFQLKTLDSSPDTKRIFKV
ncbi:DMT family transporter [Gorillibacterium sp. sgz5001074]|uniref:DMT family transporter n=1 Tax=Gorillibacterium sp. sgz5001074 TaxID=3446695 RepID=UPI003F66CEE0